MMICDALKNISAACVASQDDADSYWLTTNGTETKRIRAAANGKSDVASNTSTETNGVIASNGVGARRGSNSSGSSAFEDRLVVARAPISRYDSRLDGRPAGPGSLVSTRLSRFTHSVVRLKALQIPRLSPGESVGTMFSSLDAVLGVQLALSSHRDYKACVNFVLPGSEAEVLGIQPDAVVMELAGVHAQNSKSGGSQNSPVSQQTLMLMPPQLAEKLERSNSDVSHYKQLDKVELFDKDDISDDIKANEQPEKARSSALFSIGNPNDHRWSEAKSNQFIEKSNAEALSAGASSPGSKIVTARSKALSGTFEETRFGSFVRINPFTAPLRSSEVVRPKSGSVSSYMDSGRLSVKETGMLGVIGLAENAGDDSEDVTWVMRKDESMKTMADQGRARVEEQMFHQFKNSKVLAKLSMWDQIKWMQIVSKFAHRAALSVTCEPDSGDSMDIMEYVKIKCLDGGRFQDSFYIDGVLVHKSLARKNMRSDILNPRILLIASALDFQRNKEAISSLESVAGQEVEYMHIATEKIMTLHPDIVMFSGHVHRVAEELLFKENVAVVKNARLVDLQRIARCTGASLLTSYDHVDKISDEGVIGTCKRFYVMVSDQEPKSAKRFELQKESADEFKRAFTTSKLSFANDTVRVTLRVKDLGDIKDQSDRMIRASELLRDISYRAARRLVRSNQVLMWSRSLDPSWPTLSAQYTTVPQDVWNYSFGKFLEDMFYGKSLSIDATRFPHLSQVNGSRDASLVHYFCRRGRIPTSVVAYSLCSNLYTKKVNRYIRKESINLDAPVNAVELETKTNLASQAAMVRMLRSAARNNVDHVFVDENQFQPATRFSCKSYYAMQFHALRRLYYGGDRNYVESLCHCEQWNAAGGKSGAGFLKTRDQRFIAKAIPEIELQMFLSMANEYFSYMAKTFENNLSSMLSKVLGVYKVSISNASQGEPDIKMCIIVMENLIYGRDVDFSFDLKGKMEGRYKEHNGKSALSLLLSAIVNDTAFLSSVQATDYSMLIGYDVKKQEVVACIIDYIHKYDFMKMVEHAGKRLIQEEGEITVLNPKHYRKRFCQAMTKYFMTIPSRYTKVTTVMRNLTAIKEEEENENSPPY
uniref:1-phosphatidylinositol-3-phosphate 5-kinase n=1 Tax=Globisporangium ultimum (strain ATCC 200006 / CBS 805.95 / DAOM BR144) TaxID=431595 RepID=K3WZC4_GLOUD